VATNDLKTIIAELRRQIAGDAGSSIKELTDIAATLEMANTTKDLNDIQEQLASDTFKLMAVGRFKNGKSTLVNALLGKLTDPVPDLKPDQGPMPVDDLPCTAIVTSVVYAKQPYVRVWGSDGRWQEWSFARYLRDAVAQDNQEATESKLKGIRYFEVGFPAELCSAGVTMMDSPGVDDVPERDEITRQAIRGCDTALVVYRSDAFGGMNEMKFVSEDVLGESTRIFTVISMRNREADERFRGFVWNKLIHEGQDGPAYANQDFSEKDIFFVDSLKAFQAKVNGDADSLTASGLPVLEQRLGKFLAEESQSVHLRKFLHKAILSSGAIESQIGQRKAGLMEDTAKLQQAYESIQPKIQAVRRRGNRLPKLFERYSQDAKSALKESFVVMLAQLESELPADLAKRSLSITGLSSTFRQKKLCAEAAGMCKEIVTARIQAWGNAPIGKAETQRQPVAEGEAEMPRLIGAQETLAPILAGMVTEISREVAEMDRDLRAAQIELTGWDVSLSAPTSVVGMNERLLAGFTGLLIGDFTVLTGGFGGWRSVAGTLAGELGTVVVLSMLGLLGSTIALPAVIIVGIMTSLVFSAEDIDKRVKAKVLEEMNKGLQAMPDQITPALDAGVDKLFIALQEQTVTLVQASINEEEANFRKIMEMNKQDQGQKAEILAQLNALESHVAELRGKLTAAEEKVKPVAAEMQTAVATA
jgi:GTPase SAR1 family protein